MNNEEIIKKINSHLNNSSHLDGYLMGEKKKKKKQFFIQSNLQCDFKVK